ncbi:MAG: hypothetical protein CL910_04150 [Deltaproteobacteria bacterium]|jgi:hypothetical protein|nr:hypothetical protein [Deltaproteobacteria bacterium]
MIIDRSSLTRRDFLTASAGLVAGLPLASALRADEAGPVTAAHRSALSKSPLVYVSPLKSDGSESSCHAEVWFVADGDDALVVTSVESWKSASLKKGLNRVRLWIGDHGVWTTSDGAFRSSPTVLAGARFDPGAAEATLAKFGEKYPEAWDKWGPRFKDGLADGSRVLIRYSPVGA